MLFHQPGRMVGVSGGRGARAGGRSNGDFTNINSPRSIVSFRSPQFCTGMATPCSSRAYSSASLSEMANGNSREIQLLPYSIQLPESLKDAFSSVAAGVSIDELELFLHYVLSDYHLGTTPHPEAIEPIFNGNGVRHTISYCFSNNDWYTFVPSTLTSCSPSVVPSNAPTALPSNYPSIRSQLWAIIILDWGHGEDRT